MALRGLTIWQLTLAEITGSAVPYSNGYNSNNGNNRGNTAGKSYIVIMTMWHNIRQVLIILKIMDIIAYFAYNVISS